MADSTDLPRRYNAESRLSSKTMGVSPVRLPERGCERQTLEMKNGNFYTVVETIFSGRARPIGPLGTWRDLAGDNFNTSVATSCQAGRR